MVQEVVAGHASFECFDFPLPIFIQPTPFHMLESLGDGSIVPLHPGMPSAFKFPPTCKIYKNQTQRFGNWTCFRYQVHSLKGTLKRQ
jgi:hypothetical protein